MSHTPGPWWYDKRTRQVLDERGNPFAELHVIAPGQYAERGVHPGELPALGRLIAAAPDLLDALEAVRPVVEFVSRGRSYIGAESYPDATARRANSMLMDAIAKATGSES